MGKREAWQAYTAAYDAWRDDGRRDAAKLAAVVEARRRWDAMQHDATDRQQPARPTARDPGRK